MKYIKFEFGNGLYDLINVEKVKRFVIWENRIDVIYSDGDGCGYDINRYIYVKENEGIMNEAKEKAFASLEYHLQNNKGDWNALKNGLRNDMRKHIFNKTKRSPMILPILMEG